MTDREQRRALGRRVRAARVLAGLSQIELAEAAGMDRTGVSNVELGKRGLESTELWNIAEATGQTVGWFFEEFAAPRVTSNSRVQPSWFHWPRRRPISPRRVLNAVDP